MNPTMEAVRFYWRQAWRYPRHVIGLAVSIPITIFVNSIAPPLIVASVLSRLSRGDFQPHHIWASFGPLLVAYAVLELSGSLTWRVTDALMWKLEGNVQRNIAERVFGHLLSMSANFHTNHFGGSLVSQTNKLLGGYVRFADTTIFQTLPLLWMVIFTTAILARRAALFAVILALFAIFYTVVAFFITRNVRRLGADHATAESAQTGRLSDAVTNVMAIKSFAGAPHEQREFAKLTTGTRTRLFAMAHGYQRQQLYFGALLSGILGISLTMAVVGVMTFHANVATVFLILSYTSNITMQLFQFSNGSLRNYNRALGDARDMIAILQLEPEVQDPAEPEKSRIQHGEIAFGHVVFAHDGADDALFDGLDVRVAAGEKIGLVGHSGSGKSTFTRLLLRFSDIDGGAITIDGQNIAHLTQDDLRRAIAYVPQEPMMFHRSIRENIAYGKPGATEAEVVEAAKKANAHDFIEGLPEGYDTLVGERGVKLSGGQRQRVAIARAILKDAPILVLDEATSALDSESEKLIQAALAQLMKGRTTIVVAHRLSTIQHMDRIVVLDEGEIAEQGSHQQLLRRKNGTYAKLWKHQSGGFIEE